MRLKQNLNRSIISVIHLWKIFFSCKAKHTSVLWYQMIKGLLSQSKLGQIEKKNGGGGEGPGIIFLCS